MRRERIIQNITIIILSIAILVLSIGFVLYEKNNKISTSLKDAFWDVRFDKSSFKELSNITANSTDFGNNTISYSVTLPGAGSSYSFAIDTKNYGSIDAKLSGITLSGLTEKQKEYIIYYVRLFIFRRKN